MREQKGTVAEVAALVPKKWLVAWYEHFDHLVADMTNPGLAGRTSDLAMSLKFATKLDKDSIYWLTDFTGI